MNGETLIELWETMVEFMIKSEQQDAADKFVAFADDQGWADELLLNKHELPGKLKIAVLTYFNELEDEDQDE